jgi:hypothetical protein
VKLEIYLANCEKNPKFRTETTLELDTTPAIVPAPTMSPLARVATVISTGSLEHPMEAVNLLDRLIQVRTKAEAEGREYGCNLYFKNGDIRLGAANAGGKTSVSTNTDYFKTKPDYLGDFHVHPYQIKLSDDAQIGPSITDIEEWLGTRPSRLGLFLVFAGASLCITILRAKTQKIEDIASMSPPLGGLDFQKANQWARGILGTTSTGADVLDNWVMRFQALDAQGKYKESLLKERELWDQIPGYAQRFSDENKQMNVRIANHLDYEYFMCDTSGPTTGPKQAILLSKKVYG